MGRLFKGPTSFMLSRAAVPVRNLKESWYIFFYGDIHKWAMLHSRSTWKGWLRNAKAAKNALFIGMGDVHDDYRAHERKLLEELGFDVAARGDINDLQVARAEQTADELEFMRDRILGEIDGNHWGWLTIDRGKDTERTLTSTQYRCELLGAPYLGGMAFIDVDFMYRKQVFTYRIWIHHGTGGGYLPGAGLNALYRVVPGAVADLYAAGHSHKEAAAREVRNYPAMVKGEWTIVADDYHLVRIGNVMKAWEPGIPSYLVKRGKTPLPLALACVKLTPTKGTRRKPFFHMKAVAEV